MWLEGLERLVGHLLHFTNEEAGKSRHTAYQGIIALMMSREHFSREKQYPGDREADTRLGI